MYKKRLVILISILVILIILKLYLGKYITSGELISLVGVIFLGVAALFQEQFKKWWFSPELEIYFELSPPYCSKTPMYIWWEVPPRPKKELRTEAYYFRFGIRNLGKSQAKLCEAFITELKEYKEDKWRDIDYFQQVNLKWPAGRSNDAYLNINPSPIMMQCDIGHIVKEDRPHVDTTGFRLNYLYQIGGYQPTQLKSNTKYRFKIMLTSENAPFASKCFELYWTGNWKDDQEDMFNEITIRSA